MLGIESNHRIILRDLKGNRVLCVHLAELHRPGEKNVASVSGLSREGMLAAEIFKSAHVDWQLSRNSWTLLLFGWRLVETQCSWSVLSEADLTCCCFP